ncbi:sulfatase-like hydrolase/transferase [Flammeovirga sp. SubArs3]|uniref:sulfatase-like hydrolase/transferase n=1 Tax=Flammeovirga sp. SubArs3 TaxID=2995316 RepID=UPI00248AB46B|nr:sulfatase-like hydrolase/transferase [Flammeovirga sp. SubArs3]
MITKQNFIITTLLLSTFFSCSSSKIDDIIEDEIVLSEPDTTIVDEDTTIVSTPESPSTDPNVLLIIADDLGKDALSFYDEGIISANTPTLDSLAQNGLIFNNNWVAPSCSPTRAAIITGKYGSSNGVLEAGRTLSSSNTTLFSSLSSTTDYSSALIGKWHLSGNTSSVDMDSYGINHYEGTLISGVEDYYNYTTFNGSSSKNITDTYVTSHFTDLAIDWINDQNNPWFLWLAFTAPHTPFHIPPSDLHEQGTLNEADIESNPLPFFMASIEAMDREIGRLLSNIPDKENTIIIFIGDNGTDYRVTQTPYEKGKVKGSLHQGGINTPLIVSGPSVRIGTEEAMVNAIDLNSTILELCDGTASSTTSISFAPLLYSELEHSREYNFIEEADGYAITDGTYKYIYYSREKFYDLEQDAYETVNYEYRGLSTEHETAKATLLNQVDKWRVD